MSSDEDDNFFRRRQKQRQRQKQKRDSDVQVSTYILSRDENDQESEDTVSDTDTSDTDMVECSLNDDQVPLCNSECPSTNFGYTNSIDDIPDGSSTNNNNNNEYTNDVFNNTDNNNNNDSSISFKNIFTKGELPLGKCERVLFALIWGVNLAQQDFEKYFLYFLLTRISNPSCDYVSVYSLWILVASVIAYPVNILSGWLTDYLTRFQNHVLQVALVLQTAFFVAMFYMLLERDAFWAQVFYQIRQAAMIQTMTSTWKLIKIRLDVEIQRSWVRHPSSVKVVRLLDTENVVVSGIGNMGDIVSAVVEVFTLAIFYLLTKFLTVRNVGIGLFATSLFFNVVPLLLSLGISRKDLVSPLQEGYSFIPEDGTSTSASTVASATSSISNYGDFGKEADASAKGGSVMAEDAPFLLASRSALEPSAGYGATAAASASSNQHINAGYDVRGIGGGSSSSGSGGSSYGGMGIEDELGAQILADDDFVAPEPEYYGKHGTGRLHNAWGWVWKRLRYIATTRPVVNAMCHSLLVTFLYYFMAYPVTVLINTEDNEEALSSESNPATVSNFCHNTLVNLLRQGAILMLCYFVLSLVYMAFLVRCPPRVYYTFILPFLSLLTALSLVIILLMRRSIKKYILNFVISIAQIIPYYINSYSYYVLNTSIRQDYYGFVQALYALFTQAILISTNFSLYYSVPEVILVGVCLLLIVFAALHGFLMKSIFKNPDWADEAKKI